MNNRITKFRAWDVENKIMRYPNLIDTHQHVIYWTEDGGGHTSNYILMEFVNLMDKTMQEIYEGDIVKKWMLKEKSKNDRSDDKLKLVHWTPQNCGFNLRMPSPATPRHVYEVVGNVYQNPELLRK